MNLPDNEDCLANILGGLAGIECGVFVTVPISLKLGALFKWWDGTGGEGLSGTSSNRLNSPHEGVFFNDFAECFSVAVLKLSMHCAKHSSCAAAAAKLFRKFSLYTSNSSLITIATDPQIPLMILLD